MICKDGRILFDFLIKKCKCLKSSIRTAFFENGAGLSHDLPAIVNVEAGGGGLAVEFSPVESVPAVAWTFVVFVLGRRGGDGRYGAYGDNPQGAVVDAAGVIHHFF